ncbi:hypothetical protein [Thermococcus sp. 21S9]|uniref:hypothetical protein n=1 Tax=Thermococcus sp. 21S9 TaxID=1638223 RepID=UPI00143A8DD9|nr:hypothetical protein [Thermococcus sp. 21S9]NJE54273.1 hypothetical protein [Thermococcus sp. 21S9]
MKRFRGKPVTMAEILAEENPVRRAYLLGYYLGYSGHLAWSGWARDLKERTFREAEARDALGSAVNAFKRGRREGISDRELDTAFGMYRPPVFETELGKESVRSAVERSRILGMLSLKVTGEARFLGFVRFSSTREHLGIPSFLRRP